MSRLWQAIAISRPILWPSTFLGFLIGLVLGHNQITLLSLLFGLGLTFPYSLWLCSVNDYVDFETDKKNSLRKILTWTKTDKNFLKKLSFLSLSFMIGYVLLSPNYIVMSLSFMATIIPFLYSFPPIQLKTKPFLDTATNGLTAMVIISMGYFFYGAKPISQVALLTIAAVFLGVSGMHILGTLRDYTADKNAQATTVAVLLGQRLAAILGAFIFLLLLLVTQNFPLEFRFCAVYGITCFAALAVKPGEKLTQGLGIILLMGFFVASTISLLTGSWGKFF